MSLSPEQRQELVRLLEKGEELSPEWARILFPPEKREYELVYHGKDREEDIMASRLRDTQYYREILGKVAPLQKRGGSRGKRKSGKALS